MCTCELSEKLTVGNINRCLTHIDLEVTRKCNLNCVHCSAASIDRGKEMSFETIKRLLTEGKSMGVNKVGLTGGEPFLNRQNLYSLGDFCVNALGIPIHIHSNGTQITKQDAEWIKKIGAEITIPFYSDDSIIHDKITQSSGSFSSTLSGLRNLVATKTNVCVYIVPMKSNFHSVQSLLTMLSDEGVNRVRFLSLSPTGRAVTEFRKLELSAEDIQELNEALSTFNNKRSVKLTVGFCTSQTLEGLSIMEGHETCYAAENRVHLDAFGNVFPCTASSGHLDFSAGNVQVEGNTLESIWHTSTLLHFFRDFHVNPPEKCRPCKKHKNCSSGCRVSMFYKYGDMTISNPNCGGPFI